MSIRFNCPHCQKTLKVPTEHGGKRARCPGCKKTVSIPTLDPVVAAQIEELAAAALTDEPKPAQAEEKEARPIKFTCYFCDEEIEVSATLAGQQTPCPECRRIVKVPLPKKTEPLDWRKVQARGPAAGMRRDEPAAPEGAWGSTSLTHVSSVALNEVKALEKPPLTAKQWIKRGVLAAGLLVLVAVGAWSVMHFRGQNLQNKALQQAMASVPDSGNSELRNVDAAAIHRGIAEYLIREDKAAEARKHLVKALSHINSESTSKPSAEVEAACVELAVTQTDIFGTAEQALSGARLAWADAPKEMRGTLKAVASPEARAEALRHITRKIVAGPSGETAKNMCETFASHLSAEADRPEMFAIVGIEMLRAGAKPEAEAIAERALEQSDPTQVSEGNVSPSLIALLVALGQEKVVEQTLRTSAPRFDAANTPFGTRFGFAVGWALLGNWDRAQQLANSAGPSKERWHTLVAIAEIASNQSPEEARKALQAALAVAEKDMGGQVSDAWSVIHLAPIAFRAGVSDRLTKIVEAIPDAALRDRARLEVMKIQLQSDSNVNMESLKNPSDDLMKPRILEEISRHAARHGNGAEVFDAVGAWPAESLRPFGRIGVALGLQDKGR